MAPGETAMSCVLILPQLSPSRRVSQHQVGVAEQGLEQAGSKASLLTIY